MNYRQRGYALILVLAILMVAGAVFVGMRGVPTFATRQMPDSQTLARLQTAKTALLSRSYLNWIDPKGGKPGTFACPEVNSSANEEGQSSGICFKNQNWIIGRLQWKDLGLPYSVAESDECLWLVLSASFLSASENHQRDPTNPYRLPINPDTAGTILLANSFGSTKPVVGLLIDPRASFPLQHRTASNGASCRTGPTSAFFEQLGNSDNAAGTPSFVAYNGRTAFSKTSGKCMPFDQLASDDIGEGPCFNDVVLPIEVHDVMQPLLAYVLEKLAGTKVFSKIDAGVEDGTKLASLRSPVNQASFDSDVFDVDSSKLTYKDGCACVGSKASFCEEGNSRDPVSWLSCNRWYDSIWIVKNKTGVSLQLSTASNSYRCTIKQGDEKAKCSK